MDMTNKTNAAAEIVNCIEKAGLTPDKCDLTQLSQAMQSMISQEVQKNDIDYSLVEQWTGRCWIDGKKIYQKTIRTGQVPTNSVSPTPHHIQNIEAVLDTWGYAARENPKSWITLPCARPISSVQVWVCENSVTIYSSDGFNYEVFKDSYITIQYTCTDR